MTSESVAGIFGAIVAVAVLVIAFAFGPIGQYGKPKAPVRAEQPGQAQPVPAPPPVKGPVVREVPNN